MTLNQRVQGSNPCAPTTSTTWRTTTISDIECALVIVWTAEGSKEVPKPTRVQISVKLDAFAGLLAGPKTKNPLANLGCDHRTLFLVMEVLD